MWFVISECNFSSAFSICIIIIIIASIIYIISIII